MELMHIVGHVHLVGHLMIAQVSARQPLAVVQTHVDASL
jgi:hypothetical protein